MSCVDEEYYNSVFKGESVDSADFPSLCKRAEEIIEEMIMYRDVRTLPEKLKNVVKQAICAEIEYLDANGGSDIDTGVSSQSASLGKFSYSGSGTSGGNESSVYAPRAMRILAPTGLLYRGGGY